MKVEIEGRDVGHLIFVVNSTIGSVAPGVLRFISFFGRLLDVMGEG